MHLRLKLCGCCNEVITGTDVFWDERFEQYFCSESCVDENFANKLDDIFDELTARHFLENVTEYPNE